MSEYMNEELNNDIQDMFESGVYPISSMQRGIWVIYKLVPDNYAYNVPVAFNVKGFTDIEALKQAIDMVVKRHVVFRTCFIEKEYDVFQRTLKSVDIPYETIELDQICEDVEDLMDSRIRVPFNLERGPLFRVYLFTRDGKLSKFLFVIHHIIFDGVSSLVLMKDLMFYYASFVNSEKIKLKSLESSFFDFVKWQQNMLLSKEGISHKEYWLRKLSGELPILNLPLDYNRPPIQTYRGDIIVHQIPNLLFSELERLAASSHVSLFVLLMSAFVALLYKYSYQEDIIIGMPVSGRSARRDAIDLIGCFVNMMPLRVEFSGEDTFTDLLKKVYSSFAEGALHSDFPFYEIIKTLKPGMDKSRPPVFQVAFAYEKHKGLGEMEIKHQDNDKGAESMTLEPMRNKHQSGEFDLSMDVFDTDTSKDLLLKYNTDLFSNETMLRFKEHYMEILKSVVDNPDTRLSSINCITVEEECYLLEKRNENDATYPDTKCIHQLFEKQAALNKDAIAIVFNRMSISYGELNIKSNKLARYLRKNGVTPNTVVGLIMERSIDIVIAILAVLKAGGAYLPISIETPSYRVNTILEESKALLVITSKGVYQRTQYISHHNTEYMSSQSYESVFEEQWRTESGENLENINTPDDLAYIIFTSGSTGTPKGVMIEHKNVVRLLFNDRLLFDFNNTDVWTMFHSYCFDFSVWEMYGALLYGGKLIIIPELATKDPERFIDILRNEKVTVLNQIPSAFYRLVDLEKNNIGENLKLRFVIFGGEALQPARLKDFKRKYVNTKLINMYGITETTVHVTYKEVSDEEIEKNSSNIGTAIPTLTTYVMDKNLQLMPVGVPGELCIGGLGLARGYINDPILTSDKFVYNPRKNNERIYRSGDLVRILNNGDLEYLGRIDHQVKIRGFRIELNEIETYLLKYGPVSEAKVIAVKGKDGENTLHAYIISDRELEMTELRNHLLAYIPEYMVPTYFYKLDELPKTATGKIDIKKLSEFRSNIVKGTGYRAPGNDMEKLLVNIWQEILGLPKVGIEDDFFELGGNSSSAIVLVSKLRREIADINISVIALYENPTISELAKYISSKSTYNYKVLRRLTPKVDEADATIICVPYAGAMSTVYRNLAHEMLKVDQKINVLPVELPGHDFTDQTGNNKPIEEIAVMCYEEIKKEVSSPIIIYGHCVGNTLAIELARVLEEKGMNVDAVVIGAALPAPQMLKNSPIEDEWEFVDDKTLHEILKSWDAFKEEIPPKELGFILGNFRSDARKALAFFRKPINHILKTTIYNIIGDLDPLTLDYGLRHKEWLNYSSNVQLIMFEGAGHMFINTIEESYVLANILKDIKNGCHRTVYGKVIV